MENATRFTNVEVKGNMSVAGELEADVKLKTAITSADATAAAGSTPTAAEFKKVVDLVNEIKTALNGSD